MHMARLERLYTVPLGDAYNVSRSKRTPRAMKMLRAFIARHMKAGDARVIISEALNKLLWKRSIQKPPRRVKVRLVKEEGETVRAYLPDEKVEEPKKAEKKEEKKEASKPETPKHDVQPRGLDRRSSTAVGELGAAAPGGPQSPETSRAPEPAKTQNPKPETKHEAHPAQGTRPADAGPAAAQKKEIK